MKILFKNGSTLNIAKGNQKKIRGIQKGGINRMELKEISGNIIELAKTGKYTYLTHGCNCQNRMKSGLAKQIVQHFPRAEEADNKTKRGDWKKLGTINLTKYSEVTIINAYTQFFYGTDSRKLDYEALYKCLERIRELMSPDDSILFPKIGCGLAGGNWKIVETMIEEVLTGKDVTIVNYNILY